MEIRVPDYVESIHPEFQEYFDKKHFNGKKHYPQTIADANNYVLFDIFRAHETDTITVKYKQQDSENPKKTTTVEQYFSYPNDYLALFSYNYWKHLGKRERVIALYWLSLDLMETLNTPPNINFCFISEMPTAYGFYLHNSRINDIQIAPDYILDDNESAFQMVDTIAHELQHSVYASVKHKHYMREQNLVSYYSPSGRDDMPSTGDKILENTYNYIMYYFQPNELEAHKMGINMSFTIFNEVIELTGELSIKDLNHFNKTKKEHNRLTRLKNKMFEGIDFDKHLDLYYLLDALIDDYENPAFSDKEAKKIEKDIAEVERIIEEEKQIVYQNLINQMLKDASANIK